ncbi:MAG: type II toxin-antitoxin system HicA family toxin [Polyangiaceae bacterium]|jgi:predicted RNA binding protein YcfA (HicA-like mRNA interferase family)
MTGRQLISKLEKLGCVQVRQRGSHAIVRCGRCQTVVPLHNEDLGKGILRAIERQLEPCLGERWL